MEVRLIDWRRQPYLEIANVTMRDGLTWLSGDDPIAVKRLVRLLTLIDRRQQGTMEMNGHAIGEQQYRRNIGFAPDIRAADYPTGPTVLHSMRYFAALWEVPDPVGASQKALSRFNLLTKSHQAIVDLSTGQKKRFSLAVSLVMDPAVWIAEMPFAGLDRPSQVILQDVLWQRRKQGVISLVAQSSDEDLVWTQRLELKGGVLRDTSATPY